MPPQSVRLGEIFGSVQVEEQGRRVAQEADLLQREDTDFCLGMEADGAVVPAFQRPGDGRPAPGAVAGTERLQAPGSLALRQKHVVALESPGQAPEQRSRDERHVPGSQHHRSGSPGDGGEDPAQGPQPRLNVGDHAKVAPPGRRRWIVGHQQRRFPERRDKDGDQAIENPFPPDDLQSLGPAAVPGGFTAGEDDAPDGLRD